MDLFRFPIILGTFLDSQTFPRSFGIPEYFRVHKYFCPNPKILKEESKIFLEICENLELSLGSRIFLGSFKKPELSKLRNIFGLNNTFEYFWQ